MKKVKLRLEELFKEKNVSRYYVAKEIGVKYQTLDNYYKNKVTRYDSELLAQICTVLNCDISDILETF